MRAMRTRLVRAALLVWVTCLQASGPMPAEARGRAQAVSCDTARPGDGDPDLLLHRAAARAGREPRRAVSRGCARRPRRSAWP